MSDFKFIEGMSVAHIGNLSYKLTVTKPLYRLVEPYSSNGSENKQKVQRLDGILVEWWHNDELKEQKFHSGVLIPWDIAQLGYTVAEQWRTENNKSLFIKIHEQTIKANKQASTYIKDEKDKD